MRYVSYISKGRPPAGRRAKRFLATWTPLYPAAVVCVQDNLDALGARWRRSLLDRVMGQARRG